MDADPCWSMAHMEGVYNGFQHLVADGQLIGLDTDALGIEQTLVRVRARIDELHLERLGQRSLAS